jgi:hypothetical protein
MFDAWQVSGARAALCTDCARLGVGWWLAAWDVGCGMAAIGGRPLPLGGSLTSLTRDHPAAVTPSLYVTDTACVGHICHNSALP